MVHLPTDLILWDSVLEDREGHFFFVGQEEDLTEEVFQEEADPDDPTLM